ncbi:MAG: segregation/condensation protein A [Phycisphaerales bacterium]|nr:segregation/condensation protein A [Phycisphaerales bacterium]MCI0675466.1 segregation/condensation protein A [Phycisphaerales bacterium]
MLQEDYQITLDAFRGPLDLLLYLIRRAEVDIHDIPIAQITDQYLAFLKQLDDIDIDVAGEFLVMAATLIEIKSRTLAPPQSKASAEGDASAQPSPEAAVLDPRFELVQQLLAYQKFRIAADELESRRIAFAQRFPRRPANSRTPRLTSDSTGSITSLGSSSEEDGGSSARADVGGTGVSPVRISSDEASDPQPQDEPLELELDDAHLFDLSQAYERIMSSIDFAKLGDHKVEIDDTPIALHQEDLLDRLTRSGEHRLTLQEAFEGANPGQRIGLFLATLELVRLRRVTVVQPEIDSPIELVLNADPSQALIVETDEISHYGEPQTPSPSGRGPG